jgi:hypothetical protein
MKKCHKIVLLQMPENYWIFALFPSSGNLKTKEHNVFKLDLFPSSDEGGNTYSVGSLRKD